MQCVYGARGQHAPTEWLAGWPCHALGNEHASRPAVPWVTSLPGVRAEGFRWMMRPGGLDAGRLNRGLRLSSA